MWGAVNISPPGRHRAPRSYPRRDGATCHTPRCMTHRRTPRPHDRPHISPPHPAQLSPPRPHHMPHVSVHDRIATRPRPHERPHTSPPRAAQLPAPQLRHRPHASVHDRIAIRRDRMIALTSPHRTRTQLPAPRRRHRPHAAVHDRIATRRDRTIAHPPHRAPRSYPRHNCATGRTLRCMTQVTRRDCTIAARHPTRTPGGHTLRLHHGGGSACYARQVCPHTCRA
jgi:hypothetical protein